MTRGSRSARESTRSTLLTLEENEKLEELLGRRCAAMATAVVQLFMALPHSPSVWTLQHTGVVRFVKDNPQRSYFIRVFDLKAGVQIWEQELYSQFVYSCPWPYFHTFPADDCQVGLNFASMQEAEIFQRVVEDKINQRNNRREKTQQPPPSNGRSLPPPPTNKGFSMATADIQNQDIQSSHFRSMSGPVASFSTSKKGKKEKKGKNKGAKLSKADIGAPSGFTHVSHVGWDPNTMDPDLLKLLSSAGIGEAEMKDEETSQLIFNIIQQSGGMEAVKMEVNRAGVPPPPQHGRQGPLPPPPGSSPSSSFPSRPPTRRMGPLPPVPGQSPQRGGGPPPPPPPHGGPPPPPPPASRGGHPPPPPPQARSPAHPPPPSKLDTPHQQSFPAPPPPMSSHGPAPPPPPPAPAHSFAGPPRPHLAPAAAHLGGPPPPPPPPASKPLQDNQDFPAPPPPFPGDPAAGLGGGGGGRGGGGGGGGHEPEVTDGRNSLLSQIREGKKLKNVTEFPETATPASPGGGEGIVGALMMVMQKRRKTIHSSDEDDGDCVDDDDEDDDWDD